MATGFLIGVRTDITERRVPSPPIVERLDVEEKIGSRLLSCVVNGMMDQFAFQSTKEAFHRSVVVIAADAVHAGLNVVLAQQLLINVAGVLAALVRVMNKARARLTLINGHIQCILNQSAGHPFRHRPMLLQIKHLVPCYPAISLFQGYDGQRNYLFLCLKL